MATNKLTVFVAEKNIQGNYSKKLYIVLLVNLFVPFFYETSCLNTTLNKV